MIGEEQERLCQGWSVYPHSYPTKVYVNNDSYYLLLVISFNINKFEYCYSNYYRNGERIKYLLL